MTTLKKEVINGLHIMWAAGLTESRREEVIRWIQRYPDLMPPCTWLSVGSVNDQGNDWLIGFPETRHAHWRSLVINEDKWYAVDAEFRELRFLADVIGSWYGREDLLVMKNNDFVLRLDGEVLYGLKQVLEHVFAVALKVFAEREQYGDGRVCSAPPGSFTPPV